MSYVCSVTWKAGSPFLFHLFSPANLFASDVVPLDCFCLLITRQRKVNSFSDERPLLLLSAVSDAAVIAAFFTQSLGHWLQPLTTVSSGSMRPSDVIRLLLFLFFLLIAINVSAATSSSSDELDPRFVNRNFRRPPQRRFSRQFAADHLVEEEIPLFGITSPNFPTNIESASAAPSFPHHATSFSSSSASSLAPQSNARRYPNYLRNADAFDRDTARRQLADQRRNELRMQEEERIKDEMKRLEDVKREEERIRLENDRRLAEEERERNDRRETEGLRLEAEMNEKRDGMLRQQERSKDKIQTAKEDSDRILEAYVPIRNGRRPFDPEDHLVPGHHDPERGSGNLSPASYSPPTLTNSRNRFASSVRTGNQRSSSSAVTMTTVTSTTTTTTTTSTTPAPPPASTPPAIRPRPAGRPGGRRFIGRHRVSSENDRPPLYKPTPPSTTPISRADYDDDYEEDEYDDSTTTTTRKPKRKRRRSTTTSTTPSTTARTLSPGYKERADGRIIDFQADPNFPYELKGADLTEYPFYVKVPDNVKFDCKGRHDGYYANVDLYCQVSCMCFVICFCFASLLTWCKVAHMIDVDLVTTLSIICPTSSSCHFAILSLLILTLHWQQIYHHCAIGYRYDFLCPNYTLFDQTTFTCRFINTVNCGKSANFYKRNEDLYVESTTVLPQESRRNSDQENGRFKKKRNRSRSNDRDNENSGRNTNNSSSSNNNQQNSSDRNSDSGGNRNNRNSSETLSNSNGSMSSSSNLNNNKNSGNSENKNTNEGSNRERDTGGGGTHDDEEYEDSRNWEARNAKDGK